MTVGQQEKNAGKIVAHCVDASTDTVIKSVTNKCYVPSLIF